MKTTMTVNSTATQDIGFDARGIDPDFETEADDSVREAYEFLSAVGFGRGGARLLAIDKIELS
ncbi:MAG: hypothetical protein ACT4PQ_02415 [Betaproteobacteria bacterium]